MLAVRPRPQQANHLGMFSLDCCWAPLGCSIGPEECTVLRAGSRSSSGSRTSSSYSSLGSDAASTGSGGGCFGQSSHSVNSSESSRSSDPSDGASSWPSQRGAVATRLALSQHSNDASVSEDSGASVVSGRGDRSSDRGRSLFVAFANQEDAMAVAAAVVSGDSLRWASPTSIFGFGGGFSDSYRALRRLSDHIDVDRMSYEELLELGDRIGYVRRRAPSAEELNSLPKRRLTYADCISASIGTKGRLDKECSVCREAYAPNDEVRTLPCQHVFHAQCIDRWLMSGMPGARLCPVCNTEVPF